MITSELNLLELCKPLTWSLDMNNGSPIDTTIFTSDFSSDPVTLDIYADDDIEIGTYTL